MLLNCHWAHNGVQNGPPTWLLCPIAATGGLLDGLSISHLWGIQGQTNSLHCKDPWFIVCQKKSCCQCCPQQQHTQGHWRLWSGMQCYQDHSNCHKRCPDLPRPKFAFGSFKACHCGTQQCSGAFILIGGYSNGYASRTHFYEEKKGWRPGPNLKKGRRFHTAGVLTDRVSTKQYIVAVGGWLAGSSLEYLEFPGTNDWMKGKPTHSSLDQLQVESHVLGPGLPKPQRKHDMVNYGTDLVVMGSYSYEYESSSFHQLSVKNGTFKWWWSKNSRFQDWDLWPWWFLTILQMTCPRVWSSILGLGSWVMGDGLHFFQLPGWHYPYNYLVCHHFSPG